MTSSDELREGIMKAAVFVVLATLFLYLMVGFGDATNGFYVLGLTCGAFMSGVLVHDELLKRQRGDEQKGKP